MKKIPTLFEREFRNHKVVGITEKVTEGMEWVLEGEGTATIKVDGACCAIIGEKLYKRYDAKKGRTPPKGAIPCCDPDPVTGHWPHWLICDPDDPADKWFCEAYKNTVPCQLLKDRTYEAVGPHFQGNPYHLPHDILEPHGIVEIECKRSFEGIREYLRTHDIEGIVFWKDGEPKCKIKRSDFGFPWPYTRQSTQVELVVNGRCALCGNKLEEGRLFVCKKCSDAGYKPEGLDRIMNYIDYGGEGGRQ